MKKTVTGICIGLLVAVAGAIAGAQVPDQAHWPQWRGPFFNGMARNDAPTVWSDSSNIKWKADIPGRGHSTPVIWGDKIFLTTAIPTGKADPSPPAKDAVPLASAPSGNQQSPEGGGQQRRGRDTGPQAEHRFDCKILWESSGLGTNAIPVPVDQNGVVYVMSGFRDPRLMAIRLGKEGDLSGSDSIVWSYTRGLAYTTSPVLHENKLYVVTDNGMISVSMRRQESLTMRRYACLRPTT